MACRLSVLGVLLLALQGCAHFAGGPEARPDPAVRRAVTSARAALAAAAQSLAAAIDSHRDAYRVRSLALPPPRPGWARRSVSLWSEDGEPVKLRVSELTDGGRRRGHTAFYYREGELLYVIQPYASYVFNDGRLLVWMDAHGRWLRDVAQRDVAARQRRLLERSRRYLALF